MELRPYQREILATSLARWRAGVTRQVVVAPTGTGKTICFAALPGHHGFAGTKKLLILVHREELADQAADKVRRYNPGLNVGVEMGVRRSADWDDVVVASVPTIGREGSERLAKFRPEEFACVVQDECHHAAAASFRRVYAHFGCDRPGGQRLLLGFTATPNRSDGEPLAEVFDELVWQYPLRQAIADGWLVDLRARQVHTGSDISGVHTRQGDFATGELERAVNTPERNALVVSAWRQHAAGRRTIAFCVDVQHARDLAATFTAAGIGACAVWGDMPPEERAEALAGHRAGGFPLLMSVMVLSEGYDDPGVECILLARPTKSALVMTQQVGRGLRLAEGCDNLAAAGPDYSGKRDCLVLDFVDNTGRHSLAGVASLVGLAPTVDARGGSVAELARRYEAAAKERPDADLARAHNLDELETVLREVDMFDETAPAALGDIARMAWHANGGGFGISLPGRGGVRVEKNMLDQWTAMVSCPPPNDHADPEKAVRYMAAREVLLGEAPPHFGADVGRAIRWAEGLLERAGFGSMLRTDSAWRGEAATPKQLALLRKLGVTVPAGVSKGAASAAISRALGR